MQALRADDRQAGIRIAQHQHGVRLNLHHQQYNSDNYIRPNHILLLSFLINETHSEDAVLAIRNSRVSDLRHSHIISAAGLSRPKLICVLLLARKQWPSAMILGVSELGLQVSDQRIVSNGRICPSDSMNSIRRELSDLP